jgi:transposase
MLTLHCEGHLTNHQIARRVGVSRSTLQAYFARYRLWRQGHPEALDLDRAFLEPVVKREHAVPSRYPTLIETFPRVAEQMTHAGISLKAAWSKYRQDQPHGYSYTSYHGYYRSWHQTKYGPEKGLNRWTIRQIPNDDMAVLKTWRRSGDRRKWERAVVILEAYKGCCLRTLCSKVERARRLVQRWITDYTTAGLDGLRQKRRHRISPDEASFIEEKKKRIVEILHQSPQLFGINRASWSLRALAKVNQQEHGVAISLSTISAYLRSMGYRMRKAKKVLTSPDPDYRAKLLRITETLARLGPRDKFFCIDEYGPFAVKRQGGKAWVQRGIVRTVPQRQKSKGHLIITAALELSSNQMTHFFSEKKDTDEMIKLLTVLLDEYRGQACIFFCWDAASWHASKKLYQTVERVNAPVYRKVHGTPSVRLTPLPSSAQFLNVIESVFSGMAKAIIHNSDYGSLEECRRAIDGYIAERNHHYKDNPKRAGCKIWGKELVHPEFRSHNNCKDPNWR